MINILGGGNWNGYAAVFSLELHEFSILLIFYYAFHPNIGGIK